MSEAALDPFVRYRASRPGPQRGAWIPNVALLVGAVLAGTLWYFALPRVIQGGGIGLGARDRTTFPDGVLTVVHLDVGQGEAVFYHTPGGHNVLIDVGEGDKPEYEKSGQYPATKQVVIPFLDEHGITNLDLVIMTHPDSDHGGGMSELIDWIYRRGGSIRLLIDPGIAKGSAWYEDMLRMVQLHKVKYATVLDPSTGILAEYPKDYVPGWEGGPLIGKDVLGDPYISFQIVGPLRKIGGGDDSANTNSVVTRIQCGNYSFLQAGDADEAEEQTLLLQWGDRLKSTVHFAPHHGSKTAIYPNWLRVVNPEIISVSSHPSVFGHPHKDALAAWKTYISPPLRFLFTTSPCGDIWFRTDGRKLAIRTQFTYDAEKQWEPGKRLEHREYRKLMANEPTTWEECKPVPGTDAL